MKDEPDITKSLRETELLGNIRGRSQNSYEELQAPKESLEDTSDKTTCFVKNDAERKKSEDDLYCEKTVEELRKSEERFRSLVETTSDWIWEVDKNGVYTYASPKVKDLLGYEPEEIVGKTPFDCMLSDEVERVAEIFQDIIKKQKPFTALENTNLHKDGRHVVLETSGEPFFDADENLLGYRGIDRDITKRKKADEKLKVSEGEYKVLFNASPEMIHQVDTNGVIVATNPSITRILGYSQQEIIGKKLSDIFTDSSKKIFDGKFPELAKKGYDEGEVEIVCKDGTTKNVFCSRTALYDENNNFNGGVFYQHDITEGKKADEQIKQSEERYRTMFESANDGIIIIEKKGGITDINQTASNLFGRPREEYIGKNLKEVVHLFTKRSQARILKNFALRMLGKHISPYEVEMYMPEGEIKTVEINAVPLKRDEKVYGDLAILRDVTFRKKAEESLKENEERLRVVLGSVKEGITFSDESGEFEVFNPEIERLTGYSMEDANAHPAFSKLLYPDSKEQNKALDGLNKLTKTGDIYETETRIKTKDGEFRDLLVSTTIVYHQDKKMFLSAYRDISERKRLTNEMKIKDNAIDSSASGIAIVDLKGNISYANRYFLKIWGYDDLNNIVGEPFVKFLQKKGKSITILDELTEKKTFIDELVAERKDGSFFDVQLSASIVNDDNERPICMMTSFVDVTEDKKLREELKEKVDKLETYKESTVDREIKMVELKKEMNKLYEKLGEKPKYVIINE